MNGDFINYNQILPKQYCSVFTINKQALENSLEQGAIISRMTNDNKVRLTICENVLNLKTMSEIGEWSDNLPIELNGDDIDIGFNMNYIRECLKAIDDEYVKFNISGKIGPCIVQGDVEDTNSLYLILPLRQL